MTTASNETMLSLDSLDAFYGKAQILFGMTLEVRRGEVVVLLGRNGAGKTTTFKSIMGIVKPKGGTLTFKGLSIHELPPFKTCALGLGYVPEDRRIFSKLSVQENLEVGRQSDREGYEPWTSERLFELFPNLGERRHQDGGTLSGGEQQMLTIARTLMGNPEMIILDEPSEGLAPVIVDQLAATIERLKQEGVSILLAEQNLEVALRLSDRGYVIDNGTIRYHGTSKDLRDNADVRDKYLSV